MKLAKIFITPWIRYFRNSPTPYEALNIIRDNWEYYLRYETHTREAQALLARHGPGPYWISQSPFLESPLPPWALAALLGGESAHGTRRFPRFLFGHELLQTYHQILDDSYIHIQIRAVREFLSADRHTIAVVSELIRQYRATLPYVFGGIPTHLTRVQVREDNVGYSSGPGP